MCFDFDEWDNIQTRLLLFHACFHSVSREMLCKCDAFPLKITNRAYMLVLFCPGCLVTSDVKAFFHYTITCSKRRGSPLQLIARDAALPVALHHPSCYYLLASLAANAAVMSWHDINQGSDCVGGSLLRRLAEQCVPTLPFQNHWMWELLELSAHPAIT